MPVAFGHQPIDRALGGGLPRGRLHELIASMAADAPAAIGLAVGLAARAAHPSGSTASASQLVWLRHGFHPLAGQIHPPGLAALAPRLPPLLLVTPRRATDFLRATREAALAGGIVIAESWGSLAGYDLTASRRLQLAAEGPGTFLLLLRLAAAPAPSAAETRWSVTATSSEPLEAGAPGHPVFALTLLRQRGGTAGGREWKLAWHHEQGRFLSGDPSALAAGRAGAGTLRLAG